MTLETVMPTLLAILFVFFVWFIPYYTEKRQKEHLFTCIQFIQEKAETKSEYDLYSFVQSQQAKMKLFEHKQEYILNNNNEQEKLYAKEILETFANNIIKSYFNGLRYTDKKCYKLNDREHSMFSLWCFLSKDYDTMDWKLKDKVYTDREEIDSTHFNLLLSDFGRAYYKLYYIATKFCEENYYTKDSYRVTTSKHIEDYLKNNKVGFWRYRP